ncbi:type I pullulanase [Cytobacillus firmus]|uniref:type I pullulanase n=1 Tax=Cytobacillus firmus TaxID=1399 RepID=UPI000E178852|nr:type I pullulanase [Cytobacillus firmus]MBG9543954.1 pullulanase [Cytobacillus firmus]MBG9551992.1 pullulanase [Cytobacillus firmus]MBG9557818.1 pullulanase [Cytobacillus firmus]MBG9576272.1 pullulanase [Cytobacillus firmus]MEC1895440.1 type I pullulanase [Cytobacillus firmus]
MITIERTFNAYLDEMHIITILLPFSYHQGRSSGFSLLSDVEEEFPVEILKSTAIEDAVKYICRISHDVEFGKQYWIVDEYGGKTDLQIGAVIRTSEFDEKFYFDGPLGISYTKEKTDFRLWAPTALKVKLKLKRVMGEEAELFPMERGERGVWSCEVTGDLDRFLYSFLVCINLEWKEAVDPYAVSSAMNGEYGAVVNLESTKIKKPELPPLHQPTDAIIYETHIRDFTIHPGSGAQQKGLYLGAGETNTVGSDGEPTCLSYVKQLGVTHIEFLPVHDFEGVNEKSPKEEYNWGYNPLHFNVPEGSYSSDPLDPYSRIRELKALVQAVHSQGLRVIMDVVYNHVYIREHSSFEKIVPGYFFRHDQYGMPSNGTGVGNDFASERLMARKFIADSVSYWMKEYQIDGFRFDLMGILDIETMNEVRRISESIDPAVIIIGEGWDLNTPIPEDRKASIRNQEKLPGIGQFNDWFRDSIKGSTFNLYDKGYALGNDHYYDAAKQVLAGSIGLEKKEKGIFLSPSQSVNYVESHDNHTLWDKILVCSENADLITQQKKHRLATVMVLLSQGIPFLHSGQEFYRTKGGNGNSYRAPDSINQLDWERKSLYFNNVEYIKGMISIRRSIPLFRLADAELIRNSMRFMDIKKPLIGYVLTSSDQNAGCSHAAVLINPSATEEEILLPDGDWDLIADEYTAGNSTIRKISTRLTVPPISSYVLVCRK